MTIFLFILLFLAIFFAISNLKGSVGLLALGEGTKAAIGFIVTVLWVVVAILIWVFGLKDRVTKG